MLYTARLAQTDSLCESYCGVPEGFGPGSAGHPNRAGMVRLLGGTFRMGSAQGYREEHEVSPGPGGEMAALPMTMCSKPAGGSRYMACAEVMAFRPTDRSDSARWGFNGASD